MAHAADMRLRTLGGLELSHKAFTRPKPLLLLCYLALEGPKERRHLAELFFREATDPLNRLAVTLARLRKAGAGLVGADNTRVWTDLATDARALLTALERGEYDVAVSLYRGPFLEGVYVEAWGGELGEWIYSTRDFLASHVKTAHLALAGRDAERGRFQDAATHAERACKVAQTAGLEFEDVRRAHTLLLAGHHPHALTLLKEAEGFGLSLLETVDEARNALGYSATPLTNLGAGADSFIGREGELADLAALLAKPGARLVSISGGGGVGKTRLATEVARGQLGLGEFKDGVFFVALGAVSSSTLIPAKIAEALGLELESGDAPLAQVRRHLDGKTALLVLDNFEHLLDGAPLLPGLLESCPRLKLLVTSREGLNLKGEWRFPLSGLSFSRYPDSYPDSRPDSHPDLEPRATLAAPALFIERARQLQPAFDPDPDTLRAVYRICRLLQGYPLGLELAATLVRVVPCAEVAAELERNLDLLTVSTRSLPERHRSLRAVFDYSWALLTPREQETLRKLAVFRGGFTRAAAADVVGATIPTLLSLVDKSLLRAEGGRFDEHPLLDQYTREKGAEHHEERAATEAGHAAYFSRFSAGLRLQFNGPDPKGTLARLEADFENCRAAWRWAVGKGDADVMLGFANAFWFYYGNWSGSEAVTVWDDALGVLDEHDPAHREAVGFFLALHAQYHVDGFLARARASAERALTLLRPFGNKMGVAICLGVLSAAAEAEGRFDDALTLLKSEEPTPDRRGERPLYLAWVEMNRGNYAEAKTRFFEALETSQRERFTRSVVYALWGLGRTHFLESDYEAAGGYYHEGLTLARERGFEPGADQADACLLGLGEVALELGKLDQADAFAREALARQRRPHDLISSTVLLGRVATRRGDHQGATAHFKHALHVFKNASGTPPTTRVADVSPYPFAFYRAVGRARKARGRRCYKLFTPPPAHRGRTGVRRTAFSRGSKPTSGRGFRGRGASWRRFECGKGRVDVLDEPLNLGICTVTEHPVL